MHIDDLLPRLQRVKRAGKGYIACCPAHEDRQQSLSLTAADEDGKILLKCHAGCSFTNIVAAMDLKPSDMFPEKPKQQRKRRTIAATYDYTDEQGKLLYQVVRYIPKTFAQRRPKGDNDWEWNLNGVRRVLYRLPKILQAIKYDRPIFLVEGEKDVHTLEEINLIATTNAGGAAKWDKAYTDVLKEARVVILPDNDAPGQAHAEQIAKALPNAIVIELPDLPPKGDVTDWIAQGHTRQELVTMVKEKWELLKVQPEEQPSAQDQCFIPLGIHNDVYYIWSRQTGAVHALTSAALSRKTTFFSLAPIQYWEVQYPQRGSGWDVGTAASDLMLACCHAGQWDNAIIRGRGAWWDSGRVILHQGTSMLVDGAPASLGAVSTRYIYPANLPLEYPISTPASLELARDVLSLFEALNFETPFGQQLLAGWAYLAPICGVLPWRSHIWLTGAAGTGKTWIMNQLLSPLIGSIAIRTQSSTSEAGLRQQIGADARPVLFDEIETEDKRSWDQVQRVIELARACSSEEGGSVVKGTPSGQAQAFLLRSSMLMSSIGVPLRRRADLSRFTVLSLAKHTKSNIEEFNRLTAQTRQIATVETAGALLARACLHASWLRTTAQSIAVAISDQQGDRRLGDQLGTLLAGYWGLGHDTPPTTEDVKWLLERVEFDSLTPETGTTDELQCLACIAQQIIPAEGIKGRVERSIEELLIAFISRTDTSIPPDNAADALQRHGIIPDKSGILVANQHHELSRLLQNTPYQNNWARYLRRLDDGKTTATPQHWPGAGTSRATLIPLHHWGLTSRPVDAPEEANPDDGQEEELPF